MCGIIVYFRKENLNNKKNIDFLINDSEIFKIVKKNKILRLTNKKKNFFRS
jgi:hypothetical protein